MTEVRRDFLNWRPDRDEFDSEGLQVADNVLHDVEGYKQTRYATDGAASTLNGTSGVTITSFQARQVGSLRDSSSDNKIGLSATVSGLKIQSYGASVPQTTVSFATAATSGVAIRAFQVTELGDNAFVAAEVRGVAASGTEVSANFTGYIPV